MNNDVLISEILASAVSPVFLLAGVGALLNVMTGRLGRIVDRLRYLQEYIDKANSVDKQTILLNRKQSVFRMRLIYASIFFCTLSGLMVCIVIGALFIGEINTYSIDVFISILFILCMASLILSFILLATEIFIATKTINRNLIKTESIISKYR
ncbi:DUF2721 domain-containing protein [Gammaproteobacteria bacterium]|nr:DUF2721 domain-containing protein [Gammaproteobacteria bacterium]